MVWFGVLFVVDVRCNIGDFLMNMFFRYDVIFDVVLEYLIF